MIAIVPRGGGLCAAGKSFEQFTQQKVENKMNQHNRAARLCRLFFSTLYISSFTFGGGFVIVTLMKKKFVDELHWITEEEMLDMTALAESAPGAIAVNAAILVGWQVEGLLGMILPLWAPFCRPWLSCPSSLIFTMCLPPTCMWHWC